MNNLDSLELECSHVTENREKYDVSINDKKKIIILCDNCVDCFKSFSVIKFLSKILEKI